MAKMSMMEGQSIGQSPLLDGTNYAFLKSRMRVLLTSVDNKAWKAVVVAWKPPQIIYVGGVISKKSEEHWSEQDKDEVYGNSKEINAITTDVDRDNFWII